MFETHKTHDGRSIKMYVARPRSESIGNIVLIQEIFGVNHHIRNVCNMFAEEGFLTIAPSLFDRVNPNVDLSYNEQDIEKGIELRKKLDWENVYKDVALAHKVVNEISMNNTAVLGFCYGGSVAWRCSANLDIFQSAVCYYGGEIPAFKNEKPTIPTLAHFGLRDTHIPQEEVRKIKALNPEIIMYVYDADHGFNCDERDSYNKEAADLAFKRTLEFLKKV
jgi:carboxymethylenebutenolidase